MIPGPGLLVLITCIIFITYCTQPSTTDKIMNGDIAAKNPWMFATVTLSTILSMPSMPGLAAVLMAVSLAS
ncbi:hypothetical protein BGZ63DRAFT_388137 [Mariannaea sp. PMI_226]|nr:hypothetical protein BGZ63DRAFT_388137 [Mariannaea sp. PMI_226]